MLDKIGNITKMFRIRIGLKIRNVRKRLNTETDQKYEETDLKFEETDQQNEIF